MTPKPFSWKERRNSFGYAWLGIKALFKTEHNAWIHAGVTAGVVVAALVFKVSRAEAVLLLLNIGFVFVTEILNTAVEKLADFVSIEKHPQIGLVKDLAAAAVLIASLIAVACGAIIFIPKIF